MLLVAGAFSTPDKKIMAEDMAVAIQNTAELPGSWFWLALLWVVGLVIVSLMAYRVAEQDILGDMEGEALMMADSLDDYLRPYQNIAESVAELNSVRQALSRQALQTASLNRFLQRMALNLDAEFIYVINNQGRVIATSNSASADSLMANDLSFRPYFQQAVAGQAARYFAYGMNTGRPGYFFAAPVVQQGDVVGVAVVKLALTQAFRQLEGHKAGFLIVGYDGVIIAASDAEWRRRTLYPMPDRQRHVLIQAQRYGITSLSAVGENQPSTAFESAYIYLNKRGLTQRYLVRRAVVREAGWHVMAVSPLSKLYQQILLFCFYYTLFIGVLLLLWMYWRKRAEVQKHVEGMNQELERRVKDLTTELVQSNDELQELVDHYRRSQSELQETQGQLIQAAKLAVLGEMSAGINHELNQPLLALQTYVENSQRLMAKGKTELVDNNLAQMHQILQTMQGIVSRLKVFSRRTPPEPRMTDWQEIINGVMLIMNPLLKKSAIRVDIDPGPAGLQVYAEPVQIQQVLVNLLTNAAEAMHGQSQANIRIRVTTEAGFAHIRVQDSGPGIAADLREKIFEPFYTTKSSGLGIGLALSRRIVETLGGSLLLEEVLEEESEPGSAAKTVFVLTLPTAEQRRENG